MRKVIKRKYSDLGFPRDPRALQSFLAQSKKKIAEVILSGFAGVFMSGKEGIVSAAARVAQGALKGKMMEQTIVEIKSFVGKGRIPEDFAEKLYGFQSFSELLNFIDSECPDEDRLKAVRAMFYALNSIRVDGNELLDYQLFKLSMRLSSSELFLLKVAYKVRGVLNERDISSAEQWARLVAEELGHKVNAIVERDEEVLIKEHLLTDRRFNDRSGIYRVNGRLTDLGLKFCEYLENYKKSIEAQAS